MSPQPRRRSGARAIAPLVVLLALVAVVAACSGATFDPALPCSQQGEDGQEPGAYPDLEALVPREYAGQPPGRIDSGRTCSADGLGTMASHGIKELRFAGSTWSTGSEGGVTLATFDSVDGPELEPGWLAEFYETTAKSGRNVQSVDSYANEVDGLNGQRIDVLNNESYQSVVIWKQDDRVVAAVIADSIREIQTKEAHDRNVQLAVSALRGFGAVPPVLPPTTVPAPS
jgi:hypothetical protein